MDTLSLQTRLWIVTEPSRVASSCFLCYGVQKHKGGNGMAEQLLETTWRTALWRQLGAAIDMLENAPLGLPRPTVERANLSRAPGPPPPSRVRSVLVDHVSRALQARLVSDQRAHRQVTFPCGQGGYSLSFFELQLYGMRHGPRTCGPGFASLSDSTPSQTRHLTGFRGRRRNLAANPA